MDLWRRGHVGLELPFSLLGLAAGILLHIFYAAAWHGDAALLPDAIAAVNFDEEGKISKEYLQYMFDFQLNLGDKCSFMSAEFYCRFYCRNLVFARGFNY